MCVEVAENAVRQDSYAYTAQQISLRLEQLLDVAKNQESALLQDIYCLLQQQVSVQMEKEDMEYIQHLRLTDPRDDKMRIEETKGGLLQDSYHWILENNEVEKRYASENSIVSFDKHTRGWSQNQDCVLD